MDVAEQIQFYLVDKLNGEPFFANVPIVGFRNLIIAEEIQRKLGSLQGKNNYVGLSGVVNPPEIIGVDGDSLSPESVAVYTVDFIENPELNNQANGTGITCLAGARQARAILQGFTLYGYTFYHDEQARVIQPIVNIKDVFPGHSGWRMELKLRLDEITPGKSGTPTASWAGDTLTLTANADGGTVYSTSDGSFPGPGNYGAKQDGTEGTALKSPGATAYATGTQILYAGYAVNAAGSDINQTTAP